VRLGQRRFASFFEDYTPEATRARKATSTAFETLERKPYRGPEIPAHLYEIYKPFYEKLAERAQPTQSCEAIDSKVAARPVS
jgi:hypothetical protein